MTMSNQDETTAANHVPSPCISVCVLDLSDICEGCFRSMDEISGWSDFDNSRRQEVVQLCWERAKQAGKVLQRFSLRRYPMAWQVFYPYKQI